jgi:DNA invertase Pin-like site-specific DNA recombinase
MMFIRAYLRASTTEQDANRAKSDLIEFATTKGIRISNYYIENESGTKLERPELERLLSDSQPNDIILIEKMDRMTRLPYQQWETLKARILEKKINIVVLDQPMTHESLTATETKNPIQQALTSFMLDLGAAMARDDYETRLKRQKQGIAKAKEEGKYKGRRENLKAQASIKELLQAGMSYTKIQEHTGSSRMLIAKVSKALKSEIE